MTTESAFYQILDVELRLKTDSRAFIELFDRDYAKFRTTQSAGGRALDVSVRVRSSERNPFLTLGKRAVLLEGHPSPAHCALQVLNEALMDKIGDFLLIHAGVVAREGRALILAGAPGAGKTTLVSRLLEEGFHFLSDEVCPIHTETGLVHPFPRSLWVADDPRSPATGEEGLRNGKRPFSPDELPAPIANGPCRPGWLIHLDPTAHTTGDERSHGTRVLRVQLKDPGEGQAGKGSTESLFLADLRALGAITAQKTGAAPSQWRISYPAGELGLTRKVRDLIASYGDAIWIAYKEGARQSNFHREPVLSRISGHRAAFQLMQDLKTGPGVREGLPCEASFRSSPGRLFATLCEMLAGVSCHRLRTGRLERMVELIFSAMQEGE